MEVGIHVQEPPRLRVLRAEKACEKLGVRETKLKDLVRSDPTFPKRISLGGRAVGFFEHELDAWLAARPRIAA